jgi:hypothetical protein
VTSLPHRRTRQFSFLDALQGSDVLGSTEPSLVVEGPQGLHRFGHRATYYLYLCHLLARATTRPLSLCLLALRIPDLALTVITPTRILR